MNRTCPLCGGGMKPLMTSWFCPKNCDRPTIKTGEPTLQPGVALFQHLGSNWLTARLQVGDAVPDWVHRAWWVNGDDYLYTKPLAQFANEEAVNLVTCGWEWKILGRSSVAWGRVFNSNKARVLLVVGPQPVTGETP